MSLSGNLRTMSLPDILQWVASASKTGTLTFSREGISKRVYASEGKIVGAFSNDPRDFIGQWLVACGRISEDQLRIALGEQERSKIYIGTVLVQMRALTHEDLSRMLILKTEEIIYTLFHWEDAAFEFREGTLDPLPVTVMLRVEDVLLKGVRRYDEIQRIREVFPDAGTVLRLTAQTPPDEVLQNPHARKILEAIDGARTISEIVQRTHASEFIVSKFLFELHLAGYAEIVEISARARPAASPSASPPAGFPGAGRGTAELGAALSAAFASASPDSATTVATASAVSAAAAGSGPANGYLSAARALIGSGDDEAALGVLSKAPTGDLEVKALKEQTETRLTEKLYKSHLRPDRVPLPTRPISEMTSEDLSSAESYLLSRMDGAWDIQSIVAISPLREVDALLTINHLRERGLIEIQ